MTKHNADVLLNTALKHLDPAPQSELTDGELERAEATLARIVTAPIDAPTPKPARSSRRRTPVLAALGLSAAAGIAIPTLLLGGTAYGSWTPKPQTLDASSATAAAATCRAALEATDRGEHIAVAESRGDWTYVLLSGAGTEAVCLMPDDQIGHELNAKGDFFGSYDTDVAPAPSVVPDSLEETASTQGSTDEGWFISTEGYVGSDVTGVTVHTSAGLDIEASVTGNRFAAWWPSSQQSSKRTAETWSYTLTLADGTTRRIQ